MKLKALLALALLGASSVSNAAIELPSTNGSSNAGGSELILTVFDGLNTYTRDLGIAFNDAGSIAPATTFAADAELTDFLAAAAGPVTYSVLGADNVIGAGFGVTDPAAFGSRLAGTSVAAGGLFTGVNPATALGNAANALNAFAVNVNLLPGHQGSIADNGVSVVDSGSAAYQNNFAGQLLEGSFGDLGSVLDFYTFAQTGTVSTGLFASFTATGVESILAGTFTLAQNGDLTFSAVGGPAEVPVPAAVWLFGSALIGLVGAGRRK